MITGTFTLVEESCINCGTHFAMDRELNQELHKNNTKTFYCPNGHSMVYRESDADKLRRENQSLQNSLRWAETERDRAIQERANARRKLTITNKRIANGVCPCCNRTFKQLARHMVAKHPDFKKAVN